MKPYLRELWLLTREIIAGKILSVFLSVATERQIDDDLLRAIRDWTYRDLDRAEFVRRRYS